MPGRRLGVLGGTFDPIHCGHVDAAHAAAAALGLTDLIVVPSFIPPHRPQPIASSYHRFAMVALAVAGRRGWRASDLELRAEGPSYTSATLDRLHAGGWRPDEIFFITGADAFGDIATWRDYPALLEQANFAVVSRPGFPVAALPERLPAMASRMRNTPVAAGHASSGTLIFLIAAPTAHVSATAIRARAAKGESLAGLVVPAVAQHIEQHGLYANAAVAADVTPTPPDAAAGRLHGQN